MLPDGSIRGWRECVVSVHRDHVYSSLRCGMYRERPTPPGLQVKEYPDGRRESMRFSRQSNEVIRIL